MSPERGRGPDGLREAPPASAAGDAARGISETISKPTERTVLTRVRNLEPEELGKLPTLHLEAEAI